MSENVQAVTDETFEEEVLNADKPVLVDFWGDLVCPLSSSGPRD